jgi:hypothetical protein
MPKVSWRRYLKGEEKLEGSAKWEMNSRVRKKTLELLEDLTLILNRLPEDQLKQVFDEPVYYEHLVPFSRALYRRLEPLFGYETNRIRNIQDTLEAAEIPYNHRRLWLDRDYQVKMGEKAAEWMRQNWPEWLELKGSEMPKWKRQRLREFYANARSSEVTHT